MWIKVSVPAPRKFLGMNSVAVENVTPSANPLVLDTRPIFARGQTPCEAIDQAVDRLVPGQTLLLLTPFEPIPLYTKLGAKGFSHKTQRLSDGGWSVAFNR